MNEFGRRLSAILWVEYPYILSVAGDIQSMNEYEVTTNALVKSVYERARAFSLRDGDSVPEEMDDLEAVSKGVEWPVSMWFQEGC